MSKVYIDRDELLSLFKNDGDTFKSEDIRHIITTGVEQINSDCDACHSKWVKYSRKDSGVKSFVFACEKCGALFHNTYDVCPNCKRAMNNC